MSAEMFLLASFAITTTLCLALIRRVMIKLKKQRNQQPWSIVPNALPVLGNFFEVGSPSRLVQTLEKWACKHGKQSGVYECNLLGERVLVVCRADTVLDVMKNRPYKIQRAHKLVSALNSFGSHNLFSAEGEVWSTDRRIMAPTMNKSGTRNVVPMARTVAKRLIEKWSLVDHQVVEINDDMYAFSMDVMGLFGFGKDYDTLRQRTNASDSDNESIADDIKSILGWLIVRLLSPFEYWNIPFVGNYLDGRGFICDRLFSSISKMVDQCESAEGTGSSNDFNTELGIPFTILEKLVAQAKKNNKINRKRVVGNAMSLFFGNDTVSNSLMTCLWQLAADETGLQDDLAVEAASLDLDKASFEDLLTKLPKLYAFTFEVLRLMGPVPALPFVVHEEGVKLAAVNIPKGTTIITLQSYATRHASPSSDVPLGPTGESPAVFCPRRYLSADERTVRHPTNKYGGYLAFGYGPRQCPGQNMVAVDMLMCMASILQEFRISMEKNHPPIGRCMSGKTGIAYGPDRTVRIQLNPRGVEPK